MNRPLTINFLGPTNPQGFLLNPLKISFNNTWEYTQDERLADWIKDLLQNMRETDPAEEGHQHPEEMSITFEIKRLEDHELQHPIIIRGQLKTTYIAQCIRCAEGMSNSLTFDFKACFLKESFAKLPEYEDDLAIYIDNEEMDLFFYPHDYVDLKDFIHEIIYLNKEFMPLHSEDCRGLCQHCGTNLNVASCECHSHP